VLMLLGEHLHGLAAAVAPLLPAGDALLGLLPLAFRCARVAGILNRLPVRRDEKHLQAHITARLPSGEGQWLERYCGARERNIPAIRFFGEGDRLAGAGNRATPPHGNTPHLGPHQIPILEAGAIPILEAGAGAIFLVREGVLAVLAVEAGKARRLATRQSAEEGVLGRLQAGEHILQDVAVQRTVFRQRGTERL